MRDKILRNISWLFFDKVLRIFGGLLIGVWIARYLGPANYGIISYSLAFIAFFSFLSDLGFNAIVVRELSKGRNDSGELLGTAFYLKLAGGFLSFSLASIAALLLNQDNKLITVIVSILASGYIFRSFDIIACYFQAKIISKYTVIAKNIAFIISSLIKIFLILNNATIILFVVTTVIDIGLGAFLLVFIYLKVNGSLKKWKFKKVIAEMLLRDSWPLMLSSFLIMMYIKVDQIMIEQFLDMRSVGVYSIAVKLCTSWYFIPQIIVSTLLPYFIKMHEQNPSLFILRLKQVNSIMIWMGIVVGVLTIFYGDNIILWLYGKDYKEAYGALVLNIWSGIFISIGYTSNLWLISDNLQFYRLLGTIISVILNVVCNYLLIPRLGITGAAIATLSTQFIATCITPLFFSKIRYYTLLSLRSVIPIYILRAVR